MRLNIELNEKESQVSTVQPEETTSIEIDGGTPSKQLMQTTSEGITQETVTESKEGIDAGTPPEWLLKAVESASPSLQIEDEDAGAPTE